MAREEEINFNAQEFKNIENVLKSFEKIFKSLNSDTQNWAVNIEKAKRAIGDLSTVKGSTGNMAKKMNKVLDDYAKIQDRNNRWNEKLNAKYAKENDLLDKKLKADQERIRQVYDEKRLLQDKSAATRLQLKNLTNQNSQFQEEQKTKRREMSLQGKKLDLLGRIISGAGGGIGGMMAGAGFAAGQASEGAAGGLSSRMMQYRQNLVDRSAMGKDVTGKGFVGMLQTRFPKLAKGVFGGAGDEGGLMGKAAGGIGKMGGIMGLLGGGAGGIIGGIIMKGLESSPMFQAISKIMNQAFSLYLRPIGDFFGGVFKPIATILLKYGAANAKESKKWVNLGEQVGKGIIAFVTNPMGFFAAVGEQIVENIRATFEKMLAPVIQSFDWSWKPTEAVDKIGTFIDTQYGKILAEANSLKSGLDGRLDSTQQVMSGIQTDVQRVYDTMKMTASEYMKTTIAPSMTDAQKAAYSKFEGTAWAKSEVGQATGLFDEEGQLLKDNAVVLTDSFKEATVATKDSTDKLSETYNKTTKNAEQAIKEQKVHMQNTTDATKNIAITFEEAQKEIKRRLDALISMQIKARTTKDKKGKADADLVATKRLLGEEEKVVTMGDIARYEARTAEALGIGTGDVGKIQDYMTKYTLNYNQAKALNKEMSKIRSAGTNNFAVWANWRKSQGIHSSLSDEAAGALYFGSKAMANGGIISEPVFGVGRSGQTYLLGERGAERVKPMSGGTSGGVVVNINIAKVTSNVDLQQIKPIVERAILETHARRGII